MPTPLLLLLLLLLIVVLVTAAVAVALLLLIALATAAVAEAVDNFDEEALTADSAILLRVSRRQSGHCRLTPLRVGRVPMPSRTEKSDI